MIVTTEEGMMTKASIDQFLEQKAIAIVGVSRSGKKFGNAVFRELKEKGVDVVPVNPNADEIEGSRCYHDVTALPAEVTGIVLVVPPDESLKVLHQLEGTNIKHVWFQRGSHSDEAIEYCAAHDLETVHGECIMMFAEPVASFHKVHRFVKKVFGRLPA